MPIRCEIVSQDRTVFQGDADMVILPGAGGEMGVLPHHAPVLTTLKYGVVKVRRAGVELLQQSEQQRRNEDYDDRLRSVVSQAAEYFHQLLLSAPQAANCRVYLTEKRHLTDATIRAWQLGYSLMDYHALSNTLTVRGFTPQELVDAGLMVENEEGRRYDRFRGRLIIPIRDEKGRVIGFGSRSLDGSEPKYMNSPQTPLFDKSSVLFGKPYIVKCPADPPVGSNQWLNNALARYRALEP